MQYVARPVFLWNAQLVAWLSNAHVPRVGVTLRPIHCVQLRMRSKLRHTSIRVHVALTILIVYWDP
jgi:hypothetical protein